MDKNTQYLLGGLLILVVGFGAGYMVKTGKFGDGDGDGMHGRMRGGMQGKMVANVDKNFIEQMIPHHEGAIAMSKIALKRSKRPEIIALATAIIKAQEGEITQMKSWYQSWYATPVPAESGMQMHMGSMSGDSTKLTNVSAADFDKEFITEMIPHHEMAVMMANMLASGTTRPEMKTLSANIITSQTQEIESMRGWLSAWY